MSATPQPADRDERCGTYAGVQQHRVKHEPACEACKPVARDYMRARRQRVGPERDKWINRTRWRALDRLAAEHPAQYAALLAQIRREDPWVEGAA